MLMSFRARIRQINRLVSGLTFTWVAFGQVCGRLSTFLCEDPARGGNCLVVAKVDADLAASAEQSAAQGRLVLSVLIRQGRLKAMSHLP
jgi:hypothetical protein